MFGDIAKNFRNEKLQKQRVKRTFMEEKIQAKWSFNLLNNYSLDIEISYTLTRLLLKPTIQVAKYQLL